MLFSIHPHQSRVVKFPVPGGPFDVISGGRSILFSSHPPLVLVVEPDPDVRVQICALLDDQGYAIAQAHSSAQALQVAEELLPDVVLLDGSLSEPDSLTCSQELQNLGYPHSCRTQSETAQGCPGIFLMHPLEDQVWVNQALNLGVIDIIPKPIYGALLIGRVKRWWETRQQFQQLAQANQELQRLAGIDRLTQLANRHYFDEVLEREVRQMKRGGTPLSLIFGDVDYFKLYNDCYGHLQGDWCLQQIAQGIQRAVRRPQDLVARYGGEEFAVILPQTDAAGAIAVAKNIRRQIQQLQIPHAQSEVSQYITVSLGIACAFPEDNCSAGQLILAADRGLYRAKEQGRDRLEPLDNPSEDSLCGSS